MTERIDIPQHWQIVVSSKILDIRDGTHNTPKYVKENGVPLITSKNLKENEIDFNKVSFISYEDHIEISKRSKVDEGDILFAMIGTIGNPAIIKGNTNFSIKNVGLFKRNEKVILSSFLVNFLRSRTFEKQLSERKLLKGTTQRFIPLGNLRAINIPLPPINEQQQIVSKIEELFSELDKGIEELKTAQQQLKVYRQAVLKWAFEGKLTNEDVNEGELPEGWTQVQIKEVAKTYGGYAFKSGDFRTVGKYQVIRMGNVRPGVIRFEESSVFIDEVETEVLDKALLRPNDIIITQTGTRKKRDYGFTTLISSNNLLLNQRIAAIRFHDNYLPKFFLYFSWTNMFKDQFFSNETGNVGQGNVGMKAVTETFIPFPSIEEQQQIVQEIESRLSVCDKIEETITNSLKQTEALRQSILKKAFEGKLI